MCIRRCDAAVFRSCPVNGRSVDRLAVRRAYTTASDPMNGTIGGSEKEDEELQHPGQEHEITNESWGAHLADLEVYSHSNATPGKMPPATPHMVPSGTAVVLDKDDYREIAPQSTGTPTLHPLDLSPRASPAGTGPPPSGESSRRCSSSALPISRPTTTAEKHDGGKARRPCE